MDNGVAFVTGRLTRDPQFFGEGEKRRVLFSVAFNRGKDDRRKTTFIDCIAWGRRADILESFKKGSGVSLSGDLETDVWEKDGQKQSRIRLNINTITATTSNRRNEEEGDAEEQEVPMARKTSTMNNRGNKKSGARDEESADINPF
jgi:single stranded DNA-binding protein